MITDSGKYYLYRHIRLDKNEPFYIGVGTKCLDSAPYARSKAKANRNRYWTNIIKKTEYEVEILLESDNYEFILDKEMEFIKLYGRKDKKEGTLVNLTDGGETNTGIIRTKEWSNKISQSLKNNPKLKVKRGHLSKEIKLKIRNGNLGVKRSQKTKDKVKFARSKQYMSHLGKSIYQYDLEGNFIREWDSMAEANRTLKTSYNIRRAIINNLTCKGFKWKYKYEENNNNKVKPIKR